MAFSGKNTGLGCHALLQGIFPTQGLNPCLFHFLHWQAGSLPLVPPGKPFIQSTSCEMLGESQAGIRIAGRDIYNLRYTDNTTLMAESEEKLKGLLLSVKEESEKAGLKNIQKMKIMGSNPISS